MGMGMGMGPMRRSMRRSQSDSRNSCELPFVITENCYIVKINDSSVRGSVSVRLGGEARLGVGTPLVRDDKEPRATTIATPAR